MQRARGHLDLRDRVESQAAAAVSSSGQWEVVSGMDLVWD